MKKEEQEKRRETPSSSRTSDFSLPFLSNSTIPPQSLQQLQFLLHQVLLLSLSPLDLKLPLFQPRQNLPSSTPSFPRHLLLSPPPPLPPRQIITQIYLPQLHPPGPFPLHLPTRLRNLPSLEAGLLTNERNPLPLRARRRQLCLLSTNHRGRLLQQQHLPRRRKASQYSLR